MNNPYTYCPSDEDTVESLAQELEVATGKIAMLLQFVNEQFDACECEHCGHIHPRKQMLAVHGMDKGTDGKSHPESSRWFCGYCAGAMSVHNNNPECRERIGRWLACGYGRIFLRKMDSHFSHLGEGANHAPVAEHMRREFATEMMEAARRYSR